MVSKRLVYLAMETRACAVARVYKTASSPFSLLPHESPSLCQSSKLRSEPAYEISASPFCASESQGLDVPENTFHPSLWHLFVSLKLCMEEDVQSSKLFHCVRKPNCNKLPAMTSVFFSRLRTTFNVGKVKNSSAFRAS
jgi:hypothetical protein